MKTTSGGATGLELLQIAFIILKLCGIIDWSWWWVLAPTWASITLIGIIVIICLIKRR